MTRRRAVTSAAVVAADPSLSPAHVRVAFDVTIRTGAALRHLATALAVDPDCLAIGASAVAGRLATALAAAGSTVLSQPACVRCGRTGWPLRRGDGGGVCDRCRAWQRAAACTVCDRVKPVAARTAAGEPMCERCRRRPCSHADTDQPVCPACADRQPSTCAHCRAKPPRPPAGRGAGVRALLPVGVVPPRPLHRLPRDPPPGRPARPDRHPLR